MSSGVTHDSHHHVGFFMDRTALETNRWILAGTSNFAAPQFTGMWRDVAWHKQLTDKMRKVVLPDSLVNDRLRARLK